MGRRFVALGALAGVVAAMGVSLGAGQAPARSPRMEAAAYAPDLTPLAARQASELRDVVERYSTDRAGVLRRWSVEYSPERRATLRAFYEAWRQRLARLDFDRLSQAGKVDYVLLRNRLEYELDLLAREETMVTDTAPLMPFAPALMAVQDARRRMEPVSPQETAATLARVLDQVKATRQAVDAGLSDRSTNGGPAPITTTKILALRAAEMLADLQRGTQAWFRYYDGYDPMFSWWARAPHEELDAELTAYVKLLRERIVGDKEGEDEPIVGHPIGREALMNDLVFEMIPYTPEQLVAIAEREFAWCEAEMKKAAQAMGFGDDWRAAMEKVKNTYVPPGEQPNLIRDLAFEAIDFLEARDLVTVPALAKDVWRIEMMSPERQKVNPFFLGGETIQVSYPTDTMDHEFKLMSLRGNNPHFSRATVQHELIPGHHLQGFMTQRYAQWRSAFSTPFWGEGWALYWEMLLWDLDFPRSPEDRVGMLFWRMHRAARIVFSLSFHLGTMTPQECIDLLVDRVGHERINAEGEVRRSFNGRYSPLYQVAYMIGGLQFRALHGELVQSGRMSNREFHDRILQNGRIPVEMVRALLVDAPLARDTRSTWRFEGEIAPR